MQFVYLQIAEESAMRHREIFLWVVCLCVPAVHAQNGTGNVISGGAKAEVLKQYSGPDALPAPGQVVVKDFALCGDVAMDDSMAARLHQRSPFAGSAQDETDPAVVIEEIQTSFAKTFIKTLKKQGVDAHRAADPTSPSTAPSLIVSGEFLSVDEGDRTKRVMLGFGRGGSEIKTHVVVSLVQQDRRTVVFESNIIAKSGKQPGALATMGVGSLAIGAATHSAEDRGSTVQTDASRMGKLVAQEVASTMQAQKWIATPTK